MGKVTLDRRFENVVVIENTFKRSVRMIEQDLLVGPLNMDEAEFWEERIHPQEYVLVQADATVGEQGNESDPLRYAKGYFIFTKNKKPKGES